MVHHVALAGGPAVGAGCAIDALGIRVMLGSPVAITSRDQGRGQDVTVRGRRRLSWRGLADAGFTPVAVSWPVSSHSAPVTVEASLYLIPAAAFRPGSPCSCGSPRG